MFVSIKVNSSLWSFKLDDYINCSFSLLAKLASNEQSQVGYQGISEPESRRVESYRGGVGTYLYILCARGVWKICKWQVFVIGKWKEWKQEKRHKIAKKCSNLLMSLIVNVVLILAFNRHFWSFLGSKLSRKIAQKEFLRPKSVKVKKINPISLTFLQGSFRFFWGLLGLDFDSLIINSFICVCLLPVSPKMLVTKC